MKLPYQDGDEVVFGTLGPQENFSLENQEGKLTDCRDIDIEEYLKEMFSDPDEFVTLTAPTSQHNIRYVQACMQEKGVEVELGVEEEGTRLFYKMCSEEECLRIFLDYYDGHFIPDMEEYKPVKF